MLARKAAFGRVLEVEHALEGLIRHDLAAMIRALRVIPHAELPGVHRQNPEE